MLQAIKAVSADTLKICNQNGYCTLREVSNLIVAHTHITQTTFNRFEASRDNPIWGEFWRWHRLKPYESAEDIVEVRYASHLSREERRFVVSKELCHSLEADNGTHTATDVAVVALISDLSLKSASGELTAPMFAERLAEVGSVELIAPLPFRKQLIASGEAKALGHAGLAAQLLLPKRYIELAFDDDYIEVVEQILA